MTIIPIPLLDLVLPIAMVILRVGLAMWMQERAYELFVVEGSSINVCDSWKVMDASMAKGHDCLENIENIDFRGR